MSERMAPCEAWYRAQGPPDIGIWWWAVEHRGHPAWYQRSLMPGDFGPGHLPASRHVISLTGQQSLDAPRCGTCAESPEPADLDPIERATGQRGFLDRFRRRLAAWPAGTDRDTCWQCSSRARPADTPVRIARLGTVKVCTRCAGAGILTRG